jgi:hypothetical protein
MATDRRGAAPLGADIRWLEPGELEVHEDSHGRLTLAVAGDRYEDAQASKLFVLSQPDRFVCFRDSQGEEIGVLEDPARLDPASREVLHRRLARQYFIPVIRRVLGISEYFIDQTWTVETDRGTRQFTIQGRDSIRFLSDQAFLLIDLDDNRYLIEDRQALDETSRGWVDRFVW